MVHVILDNYATYKHPKIREMAPTRHPEVRLPLQPNLVLVVQLSKNFSQIWRCGD
jgi:hypothetical protein